MLKQKDAANITMLSGMTVIVSVLTFTILIGGVTKILKIM